MLLDLSLSGLRQRIYDLRSTTSSGVTQDARVGRAVNMALQQLANDVPEAMAPARAKVVLHPDVVSTDAAVLAAVNGTVDLKVLKLTNADGTTLNPVGDWTPTVDGEWDGLMHLEILRGDGRWYRRQSREWWLGSDSEFYVSLTQPWVSAGDTLMTFRIHQPTFYLPSNVIQAGDGVIYDNTQRVVTHVDMGARTRFRLNEYQGAGNGPPQSYMRTEQFQLQAPRLAPVATNAPSDSWAGPNPQGTFIFYYTIVWGRQSHLVAPGGVVDPLFESAPSPAVVVEAEDPSALVISTVNLDAMANFDVTSSLSEGRSGYRIRIYVGRTSVASKGAHYPPFTRIETSGIPYLLAEVEPTAMVNTSYFAAYVWDGSVTPDYERPMPHSTGHYGYQTYPHQDARYEMDIPTLCAPAPLLDDQDTPPIRQEAQGIFLELCLHYAALMDGNDQKGADAHLNRYQRALRKFRRHYASPSGVVAPVPFSVNGLHTGLRVGRFTDS